MGSSISRVPVSTPEALESAVLSYVARGYVVAERTPQRAVLQKRKQFEILWAVIGFVLCILPLLVYLVVYATQPEAWVVEVVVAPQG